jgi:hypothetical protein
LADARRDADDQDRELHVAQPGGADLVGNDALEDPVDQLGKHPRHEE